MINLIDNTAPVIVCPEDVEINCNDNIDPVNTGYAAVTDDCSNFILSYSDSLVVIGEIMETGDCGQYRTQTQGGWGSRASGNNPGTYRDSHFDYAFPNGLQVGCDLTLNLTNSQAVENFLPAGGTPSTFMVFSPNKARVLCKLLIKFIDHFVSLLFLFNFGGGYFSFR